MKKAFTLIEMLGVLIIITIIIYTALPNMRGLLEGHAVMDAGRQLASDMTFARHSAVSRQSITAVVFIPPSVLDIDLSTTSYTPEEKNQIRQLQGGIYTQYAIFSFRQAGDQPGRPMAKYLSSWKTLPSKTFIAASWFDYSSMVGSENFNNKFYHFPFPFSYSKSVLLCPYVAFDRDGKLCRADGTSLLSLLKNVDGSPVPLSVPYQVHIPLAKGSIMYVRGSSGEVTDFTAQEIPPENSTKTPMYIDFNLMTGQARFWHTEIQSLE